MTGRLNRDRGKNAERDTARRLGGTRLGTLGREDVSTGLLSIEVKSRQRFVAEAWFQQAVSHCPENRVPAVVVHIHNKRHDDDYVILRMKDFEELHGRINLSR